MVDFAVAKGVLFGNDCGGGNVDCSGACNSAGFHSLHMRISFATSVTDSEMLLHLLGQGLPPNVKRRAMSRKVIPLMMTCVSDFVAVRPL